MTNYPTQEQIVAALAGATQAQIDRADRAEAEVERLREELTDRENDLRYEHLRRVEAEDTIDKVKQALRIAAAGVSAVSTAEQMYAELERLRTAAQGFANVALRYTTGRDWHEAWDVLMDALEV